MKRFNFSTVYFLMALVSCLFISCGDNNGPDNKPDNKPVSIVGTWKVVEATLTNSEGANNQLPEEIGLVWNFDEEGNLTVGDQEVLYTYKLSGSVLETPYAELYKAKNFVVETLEEKNMVLTASYSEADKVGSRTYLTTLKFTRN